MMKVSTLRSEVNFASNAKMSLPGGSSPRDAASLGDMAYIKVSSSPKTTIY